MKAGRRKPSPEFRPPFLKRLALLPDQADRGRFPFDRLRFLSHSDFELEFRHPITFFVGENGSGKSTLLEAIADLCDFAAEGGSQDHRYAAPSPADTTPLAAALRASWLPRVSRGFFFRSESFRNLASYIDENADLDRYGGRRLQRQSHGESFLALFANRLGTDERVVYLIDEPEAALSPTRQLAFLGLLRNWEKSGNVQAIIATHSPILLSYPGATLLNFDGDRISETRVEETEHFRVTRAFLGNPERYLREIFDEDF